MAAGAAASRHFAVLDGLRGLAAAIVVLLHTQRHWGIELPHAFLAVDLFFVLSGFVLCHAYASRLRDGSLTLGRFLALRLARLYPTFLLGHAVAAVSIVGPVLLHHTRSLAVMANYAAAALLGLAMLPLPVVDSTALCPLNAPMWSLEMELVGNLLLALGVARLAPRLPGGAWQRVLAALAALAVLLAVCALQLGSLDIGSNWIALSIAGGLARACYGMLAGGALYALRSRATGWRRPLPAWASALALPAALLLMMGLLLSPALPATAGSGMAADTLLQLAAVLLLMPLVVALALPARLPALDPLMLALGRISYPLYAIHYPILHVCEALRLDHRLGFAAAPGVATFLLSLPAAAWIAGRYEPQARAALQRVLSAAPRDGGVWRPAPPPPEPRDPA